VKTTEQNSKLQQLGAKLDPKLREWIDRVIVPALAREYIADKECANCVAIPAEDVPQLPSNDRLSAEGIR